MITINNLDLYSRNGRLLLKELSFKVTPKTRLVFSGPNGCGKSTLLRYLAGLEAQPHASEPPSFFNAATYIPTRPLDLLLPWATVSENAKLFGLLSKCRKHRITNGMPSDFGSSLGYCLEGYASEAVYKLSSGQQALLAIYCALLQGSDVLIADEIFSTLSEQLRKKVATYLATLDLTLIYASHDTEFSKHLRANVYDLEPHIPQNGVFS